MAKDDSGSGAAQPKPGKAPKMKGGAGSGVGRLEKCKDMKGKGQ